MIIRIRIRYRMLNIRTRIRTDLNSSKRIRSQIRSENIRTIFTPSDDELPSYDKIVQQNLNFTKVCTSQQKKLEKLKEKLDSSQQAYE